MSASFTKTPSAFVPEGFPQGTLAIRYAAVDSEEHVLEGSFYPELALSRIADLNRASQERSVHLAYIRVVACKKVPGRKVLWELTPETQDLQKVLKGLRVTDFFLRVQAGPYDQTLVCSSKEEARIQVKRVKTRLTSEGITDAHFELRHNGARVVEWDWKEGRDPRN